MSERDPDASAQVVLLRQCQHIWFSDSRAQNKPDLTLQRAHTAPAGAGLS